MVPAVLEMTAQQANQFQDFVRDGGVLYASGMSSLNRTSEGESHFLLDEVFGVSYLGMLDAAVTYLSPTDHEVYDKIWPQDSLTYPGPMIRGKASTAAQVLATVTLPMVEPNVGYTIGTRFAQIWSNPPAMQPGVAPGIVVNSYGKGKVIWSAAPIESQADAVVANVLAYLLRSVLPGPYHFEVDGNSVTEMTLYDQSDKQRLLVSLLNTQEAVPAIAVGATVRVKVPPSRKATRVILLPEEKEVGFRKAGVYVEFDVEPFTVLKLALVEYA